MFIYVGNGVGALVVECKPVFIQSLNIQNCLSISN